MTEEKVKSRNPCKYQGFGVYSVVRLTGVEPVRPSGHKHLKLASLPIPAQPQIVVIFDRLIIILFWQGFVNGFFKILY